MRFEKIILCKMRFTQQEMKCLVQSDLVWFQSYLAWFNLISSKLSESLKSNPSLLDVLSVVVDCELSEIADMAAYGGSLVTDPVVRTFNQCLAHCVRMVKYATFRLTNLLGLIHMVRLRL